FIHSAYLRQGRADEFMLKTPGKRKEVLANLLQLDHYDELAEQAKKQANDHQGRVENLRRILADQSQELDQEPAIQQEYEHLKQTIHTGETTRAQWQTQINEYQQQNQQRQKWIEQQKWLQEQQQQLTQNQTESHDRRERLQQRIEQLETLLQQGEQITQDYRTYRDLQQQEEYLNQQAQKQQQLQQEYNECESEYRQALHELELEKQRLDVEYQTLIQNQEKQERIRQEAGKIAPALVQLTAARAELQRLDRLAEQYKPLQERYLQLCRQQEQNRARQEAQLQEQQRQLEHRRQQLQQLNNLDQELAAIECQLTELDKKKVYLNHLEEKGKERKSFQDNLKARLENYQTQLEQIRQKITLLNQPEAVCPLCAHPLDAEHWQVVHKKQELECRELQEAIWLTNEQITVTEREIQVLRQEYREIKTQLEAREELHKRQGQLSQRLQHRSELQAQIENTETEIQTLKAALAQPETSPELEQISATLAAINYDEQAHTCARGEVEKWRWVEIKQAEIQNADQEYIRISQELQQLEKRMAELDRKFDQTTHHSPLRYRLDQLQEQLTAIAYDAATHQTIRQKLQQYDNAPLRYQELNQAEQEYPRLVKELENLRAGEEDLDKRSQEIAARIEAITRTLTELPDCTAAIQALATQIHRQEQELRNQYTRRGALEEQLKKLTQLREQHEQNQQELTRHQHQYQVYQVLSQAFGKNGIQTLMIEQILPQLEITANHILGRLSNHQLHVRFVTQKPKKNGGSKNQSIETLDILIADTEGTRPYETYSGGEAFRVNFAIRLALARLLTQRAGATLQLLIVDEGFGTQDAQGCDRLIAAISAIADEYACILMVTHMPNLKEAFQTRIEVSKTEAGSQVQLVL
ncbi:MAG: SMC family ATPase, partial [Gloeomargarita sp. DG_1_6_bins_138]